MDPEELFSLINKNLSPKKGRSLQIICDICREQSKAGRPDFSISTIGTISKERGGPISQSIRNKNGRPYRDLIKAWKLQALEKNKSNRSVTAFDYSNDKILEKIKDPALVAIFSQQEITIRKLKGKVNQLLGIVNNKMPITIDLRNDSARNQQESSRQALETGRLIGLNIAEIDSLKHAISEQQFRMMDWESDETGCINKKEGHMIFKPGFVNAIKKVLRIECQEV